MKSTGNLLLLGASMSLLASCADSGSKAQVDVCGDVKPAIMPIINGVTYPEVVTLTPGQMKSIGFLSLDFAGGCSGTLVAPTVVLAAAHCVENLSPGSDVRFVVGENYMSPENSFRAREWHYHPSYPGSSGGYGVPNYDLSVIILETDATAYGLEPIPVNLERYNLAGQTIQAVGYGVTMPSGGWNSRRYWTTLPVVADQVLWYTVDGRGTTGVCSGDSGGPMLYDIPGQGVRVMGVVSSGEEGCVDLSYYPRTDSAVDWLLGYVDLGPCGWETLEGRCDGQTAVWCEADTVLTHDCASFGYVCGLDGSGYYRCVPPPPPCGDETWAGRCDGETAVWCEADEVLYHDCASFGWYCGITPEGLHRCVNDPCRGETLRGRCEGTTAIWCEAGGILYHACADFGYVCGTDGSGNYRCIPPGASECDILGHAGQCVTALDGHVHARWCDAGMVRDRDCTACGQSCGWTGDALGYYCI